MRPIIDKKGLLHVCDNIDTLLEQKNYFVQQLKNVKKNYTEDTATINLDDYIEFMEFLERDLPCILEDTRSKAKRMENKLREYKNTMEV